MRHARLLPIVLRLLLGFPCPGGTRLRLPPPPADGHSLASAASPAGTVQAPKPFKAAQVHLMNVDRHVLFMVYTSGGTYHAPHLFPGSYEVTVRKSGFAADVRKITLAPGARATLDFALREQA